MKMYPHFMGKETLKAIRIGQKFDKRVWQGQGAQLQRGKENRIFGSKYSHRYRFIDKAYGYSGNKRDRGMFTGGEDQVLLF